MIIRIDLYNLIEKLETQIPLHVPNRNEFIHVEVRRYSNDNPSLLKNNCIDVVEANNFHHFDLSNECIDELIIRVIRRSNTRSQPNCCFVLIPSIFDRFCCLKKYRIDPRFATITLYDLDSVMQCRYYHGKCTNCKRSYYYNYTDNGNVRQL